MKNLWLDFQFKNIWAHISKKKKIIIIIIIIIIITPQILKALNAINPFKTKIITRKKKKNDLNSCS